MKTHDINEIWDNGFTQEMVKPSFIDNYMNHKSISTVERITSSFGKEIYINLFLIVFVFTFSMNIVNENRIMWSVISVLPSLFWFGLGKIQLRQIKNVDFQSNCYEYLRAIKTKLQKIKEYNLRMVIISIPSILTPMLVYTYFNQQGKTFGEVFGVEKLDFSLTWIFAIIPIATLFSYLIFKLALSIQNKKPSELDLLIKEIEGLK